ncbi:DJ-1/PfpI family protein [Halorubellus sp. JP-L1]|uniref:DJ-1/PfpI family protein n=1 Tax=Halorubellus sp. JP-L1 TaxID=2715753 RepID=UPI00140A0412|nr:DJ-1/PfpI family protein [Halorubellus sp. JP-L1]NHN41040.1 DJ-1/PfpI family protein [Halorubellus sp. JP-L1]
MNAAILLFDGFDELDAVGPFEVFQNAANAGASLSTTLCTLEPAERVTASHGLRVEVDATLDDVDPDLLLVPGGGWTDPDSPGVRREHERGAIPDAIAAAHERGASVASVCTGAMLLAAAGVLDGRPAATHHDAERDLRETRALVQHARVVDDGDVLTCGGVTAGLDLAVHLVDREFDSDVADKVTREMEYEPSSDVHFGHD